MKQDLPQGEPLYKYLGFSEDVLKEENIEFLAKIAEKLVSEDFLENVIKNWGAYSESKKRLPIGGGGFDNSPIPKKWEGICDLHVLKRDLSGPSRVSGENTVTHSEGFIA